MKVARYLRCICLIVVLQFEQIHLIGQQGADQLVDAIELGMMIDSIAESVERHYINEEIGRQMGSHIMAEHRKGAYKDVSYRQLGKLLTDDFVKVSGDVHMSAFFREIHESPEESILSKRLDPYGAISNYGYTQVKITKENIGYLKIAHFTKWKFFNEAKRASTQAINILQNTDALIIDVRDNPGGFEDIVAYVMSHFFEEESFHLQEYFCRYEDRGRSIRTSTDIASKRMGDIPIYILINKGTGSAGESLAYMMKHLKRATIVGETSVGAGNGSTFFRINKNFLIQVATWETINAITKTSWEKTGVVPNIIIDSEDAFDKAYELALIDGERYAGQKERTYQRLLERLHSALNMNTSKGEVIIYSLIACNEAGLFKEGDLNTMGYEYLEQREEPEKAEAILKANTILYPSSANVYDSYGEALATNGKISLAIENYEKAVDIAEKMNDDNLSLYIEGLEKVRKIRSDKD